MLASNKLNIRCKGLFSFAQFYFKTLRITGFFIKLSLCHAVTATVTWQIGKIRYIHGMHHSTYECGTFCWFGKNMPTHSAYTPFRVRPVKVPG